MITTKNLAILGVAVLVLGGISFMQKSQHRKATNSSSTTIVINGEFNKENISRIIIGTGVNSNAVVMVASPDGWVIESYYNAKANEERISTLLRNFSNLPGEFRSDSEKVLEQYGLQDSHAVTLRAADSSGNEVLAIKLGRTPKGFPGQFMRVPGSNKVYLSQTGVLSHLGIYGEPEPPKAQFFMDLQAVRESAQNVDGMTVRDGDITTVFSKKFGVIEPAEGSPEGTAVTTDRNTWEWLVNGAGANGLAKTKVDGVLNSGASIRANDVADPSVAIADYGLDSPQKSLSLLLQGGTELVMEFGSTREAAGAVSAGTYMRVSNSPTIWIVTDYTIKNIFKNQDELKAE